MSPSLTRRQGRNRSIRGKVRHIIRSHVSTELDDLKEAYFHISNVCQKLNWPYHEVMTLMDKGRMSHFMTEDGQRFIAAADLVRWARYFANREDAME